MQLRGQNYDNQDMNDDYNYEFKILGELNCINKKLRRLAA